MDFILQNLELVTGIVGGIIIGGIIFISKSSSSENDLTQLYIKYKKHNDRINKSTKSIF